MENRDHSVIILHAISSEELQNKRQTESRTRVIAHIVCTFLYPDKT